MIVFVSSLSMGCAQKAITVPPPQQTAVPEDLPMTQEQANRILTQLLTTWQSIEKNPKDADLYYRAGRLEERLERWDRALRNYQRATQLRPGFAEAYYRAGIVSERMGESYELDPITKNVVFRMQGPNRRFAIDAYKAAANANPQFSDAYYRLCLVYLLAENLTGAAEALQFLQALEPQAARTKDLLDKVYTLQQEKKR